MAAKLLSLKKQIHQLIDELPENCTVDDIHYQLYLIEKIKRGEDSLRNDGGISHEKIKKRFAKWRTN